MSTKVSLAVVEIDPEKKEDVFAPDVHVFRDYEDGWWGDGQCIHVEMEVDDFEICGNEVTLRLTPNMARALTKAMNDKNVLSFIDYLEEWAVLPEDEKQRRRDKGVREGLSLLEKYHERIKKAAESPLAQEAAEK
jgi:hypothetical protein